MSTFTFAELPLSPEVHQALEQMKFTTPSPIQEKAIPPMLEGKDLIGLAQTGTGKTAAFAIPIIETIDPTLREVQAVVICPTRELAIQVAEEFRKLAKFKNGFSIVCVYGGQPMDVQQLALKNRPQILIGTPGRMLDFLWRGTIELNSVKTVILDEADEMLNMGFRDDIEKIFGFIPTPRQTVFFSATMPKAIMELTKEYQFNPEVVRIEPKPAELSQIRQTYVNVQQRNKSKALIQIFKQNQFSLALVFCNTKHQVDNLVKQLQQVGFSVEGLHGGKTQNHRERILKRFKQGATPILIATDVAARGIDVKNIDAVVNYDLPEETEAYTHRIGRTGRAGQSGLAFSLVASHQLNTFKAIQKSQNHRINQEILEGLPPVLATNPGEQKPGLHKPDGRDPAAANNRPRRPRRRRPAGNGHSSSGEVAKQKAL
jgi:ATP-dependent RNA helicase DeaD